ncbi:hypothetical protein [Nocardiopsis sp. YSL2]|uniref:hypothetical protein n=1 Tax=Nocardiopsis sp. YSL2 TaxID=2939492 RepID=UPI0026F42A09|nr:hypothetical protein [Nocardiopsis sp. YSL2]
MPADGRRGAPCECRRRLRALAAERGAVVLTEWAPERLLDIVREQRARQAATGRADAHMDGHAHEIAAAITEITGVALTT